MIGGTNTLVLDDENLWKFMVRSVAPRFFMIIFAYLAFVEFFLHRKKKQQKKNTIDEVDSNSTTQETEKLDIKDDVLPPQSKYPNQSSSHNGMGSPSTVTTDEPNEMWDLHSLAISGIPVSEVPEILEMARSIGAHQKKLEPLCDPLMLLRFLRARDGVVKDALFMYNETVAWRREFQVDQIMHNFGNPPPYEDGASRTLDSHGRIPSWAFKIEPKTRDATLATKHGFFGILDQPDNEDDGAPVGVWRLGADFAGIKREGLESVMVEAFMCHLEAVLQAGRAASATRKRLIRGRLIIDAGAVGGSLFRHLPTVKNITSMGKAYFPELNSTVTIVNAPWIFAKIFSVISPMLTEAMRKKIVILDGKFEGGLKTHSGLNVEVLPAFLGGCTSDDQCPEPAPVPLNLRSHKNKK